MSDIELGYSKIDPHCLAVGTAEVSLPTPTAANLKKPERIFLQALPSNTGTIVVSLTGVTSDGLAGGFILPPASNITLQANDYTKLKAIATAVGQKLSVVYLAHPN